MGLQINYTTLIFQAEQEDIGSDCLFQSLYEEAEEPSIKE